MNSDEMLKLENQLCFSIYAASRAITKIYRPLLEEIGLTYPQYLVMLVLWESQSITLRDLGNKLFLDSGTLTPLLKRLESLRLINRERSGEDERLLCVRLTEEGMALKQKARRIPQCILDTIDMDISKLVSLKISTDELIKKLSNK